MLLLCAISFVVLFAIFLIIYLKSGRERTLFKSFDIWEGVEVKDAPISLSYHKKYKKGLWTIDLINNKWVLKLFQNDELTETKTSENLVDIIIFIKTYELQ